MQFELLAEHAQEAFRVLHCRAVSGSPSARAAPVIWGQNSGRAAAAQHVRSEAGKRDGQQHVSGRLG